jgi:hypothetical protein
MKVLTVTGMILGAGVLVVAIAGSRTLYSWTEASGNQHPQSAGTTGVVKVTCTDVAGTNATCFVTGPGLGQQIPKGQNASTTGPGTVTLICNGSGPLRCWARIDGAVAAERKAPIAPNVKNFIKPLDGHDTASGSVPDFYFKKETLHVNGALIIGNGGPNLYESACTTGNTVGLVLAKIDHFDDIGPCPAGGNLVRAVLK